MSRYSKTVRSKHYWIAKGQGIIFKLLNENIKKRGDSAKLARKIGKSPGYVSQVLSGDAEINPTWKKIVEFCLAMDKVPVLEIKDTSEYLLEQKMKATIISSYNVLEFCEATVNVDGNHYHTKWNSFIDIEHLGCINNNDPKWGIMEINEAQIDEKELTI